MSVGLYRAAVAMVGHEQRLDAIAANIANLGTAGYKRNTSATHEFSVQRDKREVRGLELQGHTDFGQGNLERTGNQYDLAMFGEGFFAVEGPEGELYTRTGSFRLTENGVLVTEEGFEVAWELRGSAIDGAGKEVIVDGYGNVRQGAQDIGQLKLRDFLDRSQLQQVRGGYWAAPRGLKEATVTGTVHQGSLEASNATGFEEIVAMISVQRAFESVSNLTRSIQQSYSRLTRQSA